MIRKLKVKDKLNFVDYCSRQKNSDLYITRNNKRLFLSNLKIAEQVFNDVIKHGDICYISDDGQIKGVLLVVGFSDKAQRKYIKIVADNYKILDGLLRVFNWNCKFETFFKVKKNNLICRLAKKYKFYYCGNRGQEVLFKRNKNLYTYNKERNNERNFNK